MKNLIGAVAPKYRVLKSFKFLMLIVLVAIGFISCNDQFKSQVSKETQSIAKSNFQDSQSNFDTGGKNSTGGIEISSDTGGKGTSSDTGQIYVSYNLEDTETGGRGNGLGTGGISDTGGKNSTSGLEKHILLLSDTCGKGDIVTTGNLFTGGNGKGTSTDIGQLNYDTGGNKGDKSTTGDCSIVDTGGKDGKATSSDTGQLDCDMWGKFGKSTIGELSLKRSCNCKLLNHEHC